MQEKNKVRHIWSVLAKASSVDREDNTLSIFQVAEQLNLSLVDTEAVRAKLKLAESNKEPLAVPGIMFELLSFWQREDLDKERSDLAIDTKVSIEGPSGSILSENVMPLIFKKGYKRLRNKSEISGIKIGGIGEHNIVLSVKEGDAQKFKEVARIPLDVRVSLGNEPF